MWRAKSGASAIEYALIAGLIAVVIVAAVSQLGQAVVKLYQAVQF